MMIISIKSILKKFLLSTRFFRRPSILYCSSHGLLPDVFVQTPAPVLKKLLLLPESPYTTQLNQDVFALLANRFQSGFFLEIGANDGFTLSNTIYLEESFRWDGLLVEANPQYIDSLKKRNAKSIISAIVEKEGYYEFRNAGLYGGVVNLLDKTHEDITRAAETIKVWGTTLGRILEESGAPRLIDFVSIDVEGAEVSIIEQICSLKNHRFTCGCVEHNARQADYLHIKNLLHNAGYQIVWEGQTRHDLFFIDGKKRHGVV